MSEWTIVATTVFIAYFQNLTLYPSVSHLGLNTDEIYMQQKKCYFFDRGHDFFDLYWQSWKFVN